MKMIRRADHRGPDLVVFKNLLVGQDPRHLETGGERLRLQAIRVGDGDNVNVGSLRKHGEVHDLCDRANAQDAHLHRAAFRLGRHRASPCTNPPQMNVSPPRNST